MAWQRLLLLLIAVLLLSSKSAEAGEREPTAIIELGSAGEWILAGASSFGPSAAVEFTPIRIGLR